MKREYTIKIYDYTAEIAVESIIGENINEKIASKLKDYETVILDFSGVKIILSAFLKSMLKSFIDELGIEVFVKRIHFANLPQYTQEILVRIFNVPLKKNN